MSFRLKTMLGIALIEALLLAILVVGSLHFIEDTNARQLREYSQVTLDNFVAMARGEVVSLDLSHMQSYTDALVDNRSIAYARIFDMQGHVLAASGSAAMLARPFRADVDLRQVRDQVYDVGGVVRAGGDEFGRVELGISVTALQDAFARARRWGLAIAVAGIALVSLFSFAMGLYLTGQLARLREGAKRLQAGELGYQVPIRGHGELTETARVFNAMSRQLLDDHNEAIARDEDQVLARINQRLELEKLVAARTADLFEAEAQASLILESSAAGLCGMDRNGRITFINPAACAMLGYDHDRVVGLDGHHLWHYQYPDGSPYPDWECPASLALRDGKAVVGVEEVFWHSSGRAIEVILSTHPMIIGDRIVGAVLSFVDITEHKRAQETLRMREREFRALAENMPDNVARYDRQCRYVYVNPALERTLGMPAGQLLGMPAVDAGSGTPEARAYLRAINEVLETGAERNIELSIRPSVAAGDPAGRPGVGASDSWFEGVRVDQVRMVAELGANGEVTGVLAIGRDITEHKRMEMAREVALREAERLAQTKSAFLANMSHEIRTPLNAVLGMAQLGLRESRTRKTMTRFASILDAGQLLLGLVDDILDFSKIEAGKLHLEIDTVELGGIIDRALELTTSRAWAKGLDVLVDETEPLPGRFQGDALRIVQVLVNLLSNAVKFTEEGGIYLGVRQEDDDLVFTVTDTGIGMNEEQVQRLFTPFEQADGSTTRRFGGTGLGLAISRRIADMMNGRIDVRSRPGEGTEFEFRLPLAGAVMQDQAPAGEQVLISGLACADSLSEALSRRGLSVGIVPAREALAAPAGLAVFSYAQLEGRLLAQVREAVMAGRRLAVVTPPGGMYAIPAELRDRLHLLDWPPRPRHVLRALTTELPGQEEAPPQAGSDLAGIRVLAAEDDKLSRVVLGEMLAMAGAETTWTENGLELVARLQQDGPSAYDLVITDVQMPEMDGYEAARRIRERAPAMPIVGLTAHALAEERERCLASGMSAHLGKPVDMDTLVATVLAVVRAGGAAVPAVTAATRTAAGPLDWAALEEAFPGRPEFIASLAAILLDSHGATPARLRALAEAGDLAAVGLLAHNLKGVAGNLMAGEVRDLAAELHRAARGGDPDAGLRARVLATALERLLADVAGYLARPAGAAAQDNTGNARP